MASNSRGLGTIDNPITRDVLSRNSHCDLDSATVPFSGTSLAQKPLQQGVNGQQMGTIAGIAFLMKKKTMGCDCQHFFWCVCHLPRWFSPYLQTVNCNTELAVWFGLCSWQLFLPPFHHVNSMPILKILLIVVRTLIDLFLSWNLCDLSLTIWIAWFWLYLNTKVFWVFF